MRLFKRCIIFFSFVFYFIAPAFGQGKALKEPGGLNRDPFIPLVDEKGTLRKNFQKPLNEPKVPEVTLMGISKINGSCYAVIDGELVKEGDIIKELLVEKVEPDRVTLKFGEKIIELKLNPEKR